MDNCFPSFDEALSWAQISARQVPKVLGLYAIFLKTLDEVPSSWRAELSAVSEPFYVGQSIDLDTRLKEHFGDNSATSKSTFRRSVAAMMRDTLNLSPVLDSGSNYWLKEERVLSNWIQKNCVVTFCFKGRQSLNDLETHFIEKLTPRFNIKLTDKRNNPHVHLHLEAARKECRRIGKSNYRNSH